MKAHIAAIVLGAVLVSPAASAEPNGDGAGKPGGSLQMRVTTRAPEPEKWSAQKNANGTQRVFKCKPLACPDRQTVAFTFQKSPTRHPDPKALERFAKEELPRSIRAAGAAREVLSDGAEKIETLASDIATLKGYPSVVNESKFSRGKSEAYVQTAIIFAGPLMIRVQSSSPDRALAQKALNEFIGVMRIEEGPSPQPKAQRGTHGI